MKERFVEIARPDGAMEAFIAHPKDDDVFPAVVLYMDVFGLRDGLFNLARRIAGAGYYCIVPDLYYRRGRLRMELPVERQWSLADVTNHAEESVRQAGTTLTSRMVINDTRAILRFLSTQPVADGPKGAVGFCMGGRHAICVAAHYPKAFRATASLHGSRLVSESPESPHIRAKNLCGSLYCGFAENDPHSPPSAIGQLAASLSGCDVDYRWQIHRGAKHGYALPDRDIHDAEAAERDWQHIFDMFRRELA